MVLCWNQARGSSLSYLEKRQEWVLSQIGKLQERVKNLAENLGVGPAEVGILQQQVCVHVGISLMVR